MEPTHAGTFRRLASATYDGLLLLAVLMVTTALLHLFTHGEAITRARVGWLEYLYRGAMAAVVFAYFAIAWTRRGQTLGMKAWGIRLESAAGALPTLALVARRLLVAGTVYLTLIAGVLMYMSRQGGLLLVGLLSLPFVVSFGLHTARGRGTLLDSLSGTRTVRVPRETA